MIQVLSWNDYGESHHIAPIMGAEPGSTAWTHRMDHTAFREMTTYFAKRWRDGAPEVDESRFSLWMWYRSHPKDLIVTSDTVGRPNHAEWAQDLINLLILVPADIPNPVIEVRAGDERTHAYRLFAGHANGVKVPFTVGEVYVTLRSDRGVHIQGRGATIRGVKHTYMYNFNMWSRGWHVDATHVEGQTDSTGGNKVFQTGEEFHGAGAKPPHMPNPALGHGSNQGFNPSQGSHGGETQPPAQAPPAQPGQHDTPSPHVEAGTQGTVPQTGTDSSADADPA
jgi:hypothetical protein